jgi:hypothetical protein
VKAAISTQPSRKSLSPFFFLLHDDVAVATYYGFVAAAEDVA